MFLRTFSELILSGKTNTWNGKETGLRFIDFMSRHYLSSNISSLSIPFVASCAIITVSSSKLFIARLESGWAASPGRSVRALNSSANGWRTNVADDARAPCLSSKLPHVINVERWSWGREEGRWYHLCLSKFTGVEVEAGFKFARSGIGRVVKHNFAASSFSLRNSN